MFHVLHRGPIRIGTDRLDGQYRKGVRQSGFTLIELLAVTMIIAALAALAIPRYRDMVERAKVARAIGDIRAIAIDVDSRESLPATLAEIGRADLRDPWSQEYVYYPFPDSKSKGPPSGARRDRFLVPVNSTYDLYSMGADGKTVVAFTAQPSHDDVVRASDGGYIGLASRF